MNIEKKLGEAILTELRFAGFGDGNSCVVNTANAIKIAKIMAGIDRELNRVLGDRKVVVTTTVTETPVETRPSIGLTASVVNVVHADNDDSDGSDDIDLSVDDDDDDDSVSRLFRDVANSTLPQVTLNKNKNVVPNKETLKYAGNYYVPELGKYIRHTAIHDVSKTQFERAARTTKEMVFREFLAKFDSEDTLPTQIELIKCLRGYNALAGKKFWTSAKEFYRAYAEWLDKETSRKPQ